MIGREAMLGSALTWTITAIGYVAAALFGAMALIISYDVIARVLLHSPTRWALETATYVMVAAVFLGGPYVLLRSEHIAVDLLMHVLPKRIARGLLRFSLVATVLLFALIAVVSAGMVLHSIRLDLVSPTIHLPAWLFQVTIPIGATLMSCEALRQLLASPRPPAVA